MRVVSIGEVKQLDHKEVVPSVRGILKSVFKPNAGTNDHGPWSIQNVMLKDSSGEIKVSLRNRDEIPLTAKGQAILIECNDGDKGKTGVYAEDDDYRGKVERIIKVTGSAKIEIGNGATETTQTPPPPSPPTGTGPTGAATPPKPQTTTPQTQTNGNGHGDSLRNAAKRLARDYYRTMEAVLEMRIAWDKENPHATMTDTHYQAACASVFIQLSRDGLVNGNGH